MFLKRGVEWGNYFGSFTFILGRILREPVSNCIAKISSLVHRRGFRLIVIILFIMSAYGRPLLGHRVPRVRHHALSTVFLIHCLSSTALYRRFNELEGAPHYTLTCTRSPTTIAPSAIGKRALPTATSAVWAMSVTLVLLRIYFIYDFIFRRETPNIDLANAIVKDAIILFERVWWIIPQCRTGKLNNKVWESWLNPPTRPNLNQFRNDETPYWLIRRIKVGTRGMCTVVGRSSKSSLLI